MMKKHKVAIGYKNPLCLARAKQAQSALYNGHVLVTTNHTPTVIHDSEDTLELAEITRNRMRMTTQEKAETLVQNISALTVYPPNTPVKLVPRILPTKRRITPSGITEGERGFEQTKRCYLTEVIPFFKTLKEHFVGVQTALCKEVKEMKEIFDQMNNEVDKNAVDKQYQESNMIQEKDNVIRNLKVLVANVNDRSCEPYNAKDVTALIEQNDCVRIELEKDPVAKKEDKKEGRSTPLGQIILNSENATSTVKTVLNKRKQIWKPKGRLSDNSLYKTKRVWKAIGKLFADIGYQWRPTGKKLTLGKLDCGSQWRPTGKKFALGEMCHLTKLSVKCRTGHALVSGLRLFKTYDGESFKAHELNFVEKSSGQFCDSDLEVAFRKHTCFVRDIKGTDILKGSRGTNLYTISIDEMMKSSPICLRHKASKYKLMVFVELSFKPISIRHVK
ncbi:hypothetical protein Tco_0247766 [Tanacetum coccineum]